MDEKTARLAAQWWADRIERRTFGYLGADEIDGPRRRAFIEKNEAITVTEHQLQLFVTEAVILMVEGVERQRWEVDYVLSPNLRQCLVVAGIPLGVLGGVILMLIRGDAVEVGVGVDAPMRPLGSDEGGVVIAGGGA